MLFVFGCAIGIIFYALFGYPLILFLLSKIKSQIHTEPIGKVIEWPNVTLVIAAHNEGKSIRHKLENSLRSDYPKDKLEIVVVSDNSSDETDRIVESFAKDGIILHRMPKRGGKLAGHKSVLKEVKSEIVLFSDATTIYHKDAVKELVKHFVKENVGCVGGAVTYKKFENLGSGVEEQKYFSYEVAVRKMENWVDSVPVVSGAIYALRRELYPDIPDHLADDLINPLYVKKVGYRTLFEPNAKCQEISPRNIESEFKKRRRIAAQNVAGLFYMRSLLNPFRYPLFSWILFSHKVLRLALPFVYIAILISGLMLLKDILSLNLIVLTVMIIIGLFLLGKFSGIINEMKHTFSLPIYFLAFHVGIIFGVIESLFGKKYATWQTE